MTGTGVSDFGVKDSWLTQLGFSMPDAQAAVDLVSDPFDSGFADNIDLSSLTPGDATIEFVYNEMWSNDDIGSIGSRPVDSDYAEPQEQVDYGFIEIQIFPAEYTFGDEPIARTNTTSWNSGAYTIDLPEGSYKIKAFSHQSTYKSEFHNDVLTWEAATPVTITANATQTIDFELGAAPSGTITGLLRDTSVANADIGWPEITLHDPTDEDVMYWPGRFDREWDELTQKTQGHLFDGCPNRQLQG